MDAHVITPAGIEAAIAELNRQLAPVPAVLCLPAPQSEIAAPVDPVRDFLEGWR